MNFNVDYNALNDKTLLENRTKYAVLGISAFCASAYFDIFAFPTLIFAYKWYRYYKTYKIRHSPVKTYADKVNKSALNVSKPKSTAFTFSVRGTTYKNDSGKDIQTLLKRVASDLGETNDSDDLYDCKSNKELLSELSGDPNLKVFELSDESIDDVYFVRDLENKKYPDAIKIVSEEYGHLGYVPVEELSRVSELMELENYRLECVLVGGKFKYFDEENDKISIGNYNYGLRVTVK